MFWKSLQPLSIKKQLVLSLVGPLLLLSLISSAVIDWLALNLSNDIYDELLINTVDSVVARIGYINGKRVIDFPESAEKMFRHEEADKFYYKIFSLKGVYISGDEYIPSVVNKSTEPHFEDIRVDGEQVRMVSMMVPTKDDPLGNLVVAVAETCNARVAMAHRILFTTLIIQLLIILGGTAALWFGISAGLAPLNKIGAAMSRRSPLDLEPLVIERAPPEVTPMLDAINALLQEMKVYIDAQSRFVSDAAHQLRTPLAGLKTFVDLGAQQADDNRSIEIFEQLNIAVQRMTQMVNRLLSLARAEGSSDRFRGTIPVDLNELTDEVVTTISRQWHNKTTTKIVYKHSEEPSVVRGSEDSLRELAENLIQNAILYTPDGGEVSVSVLNNGGVELAVEDTGPGIPTDQREKIFDRFYRIDKSINKAGSGLGLSIVREIAENHSATISVQDSSRGKGSRFVVKFRSYQADSERPVQIEATTTKE
ncbi:MAG TPA: sensor histidine kinase [Oculatellaceae cyanobacterium]